MKIQRIIASKIAKNKVAKQEEYINRFVRIHDTNTYGDSFNQMYTARETLANYAKDKGVTIDIHDARKLLEDDESVSPILENKFAEKLYVVVTNLLSGKSKTKFVDANTDKLYPKVAQRPILIPITSDYTDIARQSVRNTEDTFLRNLYRNIEELTEKVTSKNSK